MLIETIRSLSDGLQSGTYGVNVQITGLPLDGADPRPATMSLIANSTKARWVAQSALPPSGSVFPCLAVYLEETELDPEVRGGVPLREGKVNVHIRAFDRDSQTDRGLTDMYYVMRAIERCIKTYMSDAHWTERVRNNIQIEECLTLNILNDTTFHDDNLISGGLKATFRVRDLSP
jgi:hypothetical protein